MLIRETAVGEGNVSLETADAATDAMPWVEPTLDIPPIDVGILADDWAEFLMANPWAPVDNTNVFLDRALPANLTAAQHRAAAMAVDFGGRVMAAVSRRFFGTGRIPPSVRGAAGVSFALHA